MRVKKLKSIQVISILIAVVLVIKPITFDQCIDIKSESKMIQAYTNTIPQGNESDPQEGSSFPKPEINLNGYLQNTWTKENVLIQVGVKSDNSKVDYYEYATDYNPMNPENATWLKLVDSNLEITSDTMATYYFCAVSINGVRGEVSEGVTIKVRKTPPSNAELTINGAKPKSETEWYQAEELNILITPPTTTKDAPIISTYYKLWNTSSNETEDTTNTYQFTTLEEIQQPKVEEEGIYKMKIWTVDEVGNSSGVDFFTINVDKKNPNNVKVSYSNMAETFFVKSLIEYENFGSFFRDSVEVTMSADFGTSSYGRYQYMLVDMNGNAKTDWIDVAQEKVFDTLEGKVAKFCVQALFVGKIYGRAIDLAGNISLEENTIYSDESNIVVDNNIPSAVFIKTNDYTEGTWTNKDVIIQLAEERGKEVTSRIDYFEYTTTPEDLASWTKMPESDYSTKHQNQALTNADKTISNSIKKDDCFYVRNQITIASDSNAAYYFRAVSNTGMIGIASSLQVKVQKTKPANAEISIFPLHSNGTNNWYYNEYPTISIKHPSNANATSKISSISVYYKFWNASKGEKEESTPLYTYQAGEAIDQPVIREDGIYQLKVWTIDEAGNSCIEPHQKQWFEQTIQVDKTAPTVQISIGENEWKTILDTITFGIFYKKTQGVKIASSDLLSGVASVEYQKVAEQEDYDPNGVWNKYSDFEVNANNKFVIYAKVVDNAGNQTIVNSNGVIIDDNAPKGKAGPDISIALQGVNENGINSGDIKVAINVLEAKYADKEEPEGVMSGLKNVYYVIEKDGVETKRVTLMNNSITNPTYEQLIGECKQTITVNGKENESNQVKITLVAEDNAGNIKRTSKDIMIDMTKPVIQVEYDNNNGLNENFYKDKRIATISIVESNFDEDDVVIKITKNGESLPIGDLANLTWTQQGNLHTAKIQYSKEGDYSFEIAYTDLADHVAAYNRKDIFTIDKTLPIMEVTYDNNEVKNQLYYNADRVATITIKEHNFDENAVVKMLVNDQVVERKLSNWTNQGDFHTATIPFQEEAKYTYQIAYTDKAGNSAAPMQEQNFYIDKTAPNINIAGVLDRSANKGVFTPKLFFKDTNYKKEGTKIELIGASRGNVILLGNFKDNENGQVYQFDNFEQKEEIDDIYTLLIGCEDAAGNQSERSIMFSINRFGSVYSFDKSVGDIVDHYIQQERDIVITETNVDYLSNYSVKCSKNGTVYDLARNDQYTVECIGTEHTWKQYVFTIKKENFKEEGNYIINLLSEDKAQNISDNKVKAKEIRFSIDKTGPSCTIDGVVSGGSYRTQKRTVKFNIKDNLKLERATVKLNGKVIGEWKEEDILTANYKFELPIDSLNERQKLEVVLVDAAGNLSIQSVEGFLITKNLLVQYYENKVLFYSSIGIIVLAVGFSIGLARFKRKKPVKILKTEE